MRRALRPVTVTSLLALWGCTAAALYGAPVARAQDVPNGIHEVRIDVNGVAVRALCTGGPREVLLLHGEDSSADSWLPVLERLDGVVGACAYDRRGSGSSDPAPTERGWYELVDELRRIHLSLGFDRDYILVGQGLGGLYARVYTVDRPTDIRGLLLLDPAHEEMPRRYEAGMPRIEWEAWTRARARPNSDGVVERAVGERARRVRLPDIPVTILTASVRPNGGGWDARLLSQAARQVHASILRGVTVGRHLPAPRSGPLIQLDAPDLVTEEILRLEQMGRQGSR